LLDRIARAALVALAVAAVCAALVAFVMTGPVQQFCSMNTIPPVHAFAEDAARRSRLPDHVEDRGRLIVSTDGYADTTALVARAAGSEWHWGLFTVEVTAPGYHEWVARNVIVWPTPCGARGPRLRPRLQRAGS